MSRGRWLLVPNKTLHQKCVKIKYVLWGVRPNISITHKQNVHKFTKNSTLTNTLSQLKVLPLWCHHQTEEGGSLIGSQTE